MKNILKTKIPDKLVLPIKIFLALLFIVFMTCGEVILEIFG